MQLELEAWAKNVPQAPFSFAVFSGLAMLAGIGINYDHWSAVRRAYCKRAARRYLNAYWLAYKQGVSADG